MDRKPTYEEMEKRVQELEREVLKRKRVEETLRESEELFRLLYERAPLGYQSLDRNGNFIEINKAWLDTLGYTREEVIGKNFGDYLHPDWVDHFKNNFPQFKALGEVLGVEFEMVKKDGSRIFVAFNGKIGLDEKGEFKQTHCILHNVTDRKHAERALKQSEEKHRALIENMPIACFTFDREGHFLSWNRAAKQIYGYNREEAVGATVYDLIVTPGTEENTDQVIDQVFSGKCFTGSEWQDRNKDGDVGWRMGNAFPLLDTDGAVICGVNLNIDMTARKRAEEELQKLASVVKYSSELVNLATLDGKMIFLNEAGGKMLGIDPEEVEQTNVLDVLPDHYQDLVKNELLPALMEKRTWEGDLQYRNLKTGEFTDVHAMTFTVQDLNTDKPLYLANVSMDITERKRAEAELKRYQDHLEQLVGERTSELRAANKKLEQEIEERKKIEVALRESQERYLAIFEQAADSIVLVDAETGSLAEFNDMANESLGFTREEYNNLKIQDFEVSESGEDVAFHLEKIVTEGVVSFETKHRTKTGDIRDVHVNSKGITIGGKNFILAIFRDITDLKRGEEKLRFEIMQRRQAEEQLSVLVDELERANADLQDFAYIVSHDLKAPLRGISSLANWLSEDYSTALDEKGRNYLDKMLARTKRMHNFIEGILRYSRVGRVEFDPKRLDVGAVVREVIDFLLVPENFSVNVEETLPAVVYDKTFLVEVLQNLIGNAIKHLGKPKGNIVVSCKDKNEFWEFCIRDNGIGIEERHFERIFQIFQTLKPRSEVESTGIGLSLVKKIVERNGGAVRVESTVGAFSAFYFTVPKRSESVMAVADFTVLIVDNNMDFIKIATAMLERKGHKVFGAASGREACKILGAYEGEIHVALMDAYIPGEDALECYSEIKKLRPKIQTVVCTDSGLTETVRQLEREGVDGVIMKPFKTDELYRILEKTENPPPVKEEGYHEK